MATGRSQRIVEMIKEGIASGQKFTTEDMSAIMQDDTDIIARENMPYIL